MRVLMINSGSGVRSTGRICTDLASELIKNGHDAKVGYARGNVPEKYRPISIRIGSSFQVYKQALMTRIFDSEGFGNKRSTGEFIKWVKDYDPDIVHLHNIHGYYLNSELLFNYLKESNKPVIWTLHDCWSFTGHCAYFDYIGCEKWKTGCHNCQLKKEYPGSLFLDNSKHNYIKKKEIFSNLKNMTIVTPSCWLAGLVKQSFLANYNIQVIRNGINTDVFKPSVSNIRSKLGIGDRIMILGVAAIWNQRKGLSSFIELRSLLPKERYAIVVVGLTSKQVDSLPAGIVGIEETENISELVELYSAADVFVNPTLEDNYPTTNLEAIACGTPVVTYNTGGSPESASKYGFVVEKDVNQLAEAIKNYKSAVQYSFDIDYRISIKKYIKLYESSLRNR